MAANIFKMGQTIYMVVSTWDTAVFGSSALQPIMEMFFVVPCNNALFFCTIPHRRYFILNHIRKTRPPPLF